MEKNCLGKLFIRQFFCFVILDERRMANTTLEDIKTKYNFTKISLTFASRGDYNVHMNL